MEKDYNKALKKIILQEKWLIDILRSVRELDLPDWYLAAGVIRNTVWDVLSGYEQRHPLNDIDVVYFDARKKINDKAVEKRLHALHPSQTFEVVNQAFIHEYYPAKKGIQSACMGIASFIEVPTCVGVRLEKDDSLTICAPYGLKDLFTFHVGPSSQQAEALADYKERMKMKKWKKLWPRLRIDS
ncbi:nucleotidyltransferase family protein [Candidatus Woesearchaeota archaeon]|nr:nucleotidyltransferase family protein [Candidatus Woesearchaeota archaeon]